MFSVKDSNGNNFSFANVIFEIRDFAECVYIFHISSEVLLLPLHEKRGVIIESFTSDHAFDVFGEIDLDEMDLYY